MKSESRISVIIPIYNTAAYLPRCLDSILNSTYQNLEVLCINDGSTDESAAILKRYATEDSRVIAVNKANAGVSSARNTGLDLATGDFIAFVDSDDWVHPQSFEILAWGQEQTEADIVIGKYSITAENKQKFKQIDLKTVEVTAIPNVDAMKIGQLKSLVWGRLYKRSSISGLRFENGLKWGEDTFFSICTLSNNPNIALVDSELYYYFQRETSSTRILPFSSKLALVRCYLTYYGKSESDTQRCLYLKQGLKQALACRYTGMFEATGEEQHECSMLLEQCKEKLRESNIVGKKETLVYNAFILVPALYRLFRIVDDPTLLQWEKNMKRKKKDNGTCMEVEN